MKRNRSSSKEIALWNIISSLKHRISPTNHQFALLQINRLEFPIPMLCQSPFAQVSWLSHSQPYVRCFVSGMIGLQYADYVYCHIRPSPKLYLLPPCILLHHPETNVFSWGRMHFHKLLLHTHLVAKGVRRLGNSSGQHVCACKNSPY